MGTSLAIVHPESPSVLTQDDLRTRCKQAWTLHEAKAVVGVFETDKGRAQMIVQYLELGLTQRELAVCTGLTIGRISQLLLYSRFLRILFNALNKIPERRFQLYWREESDKSALRMLRGKKNAEGREAYEQEVFHKILMRVQEESASPSVKKRRKKSGVATTKRVFQQKRKEVNEAYVEIREDVESLISLAGHDRATYAPDMLAMHADRLKRGFKKLDIALKDVVTVLARE